MSRLIMLNHRTDAQALCCWLELEMMTTGSDEACRVTGWGRGTGQKVKVHTEVIRGSTQTCKATSRPLCWNTVSK